MMASHYGISMADFFLPRSAVLFVGALPGGFAYRLHHRLYSGHAYGVDYSHIDRSRHTHYTGGTN